MMSVPAFHSLTARTDFFFVRHGESESNRDGLIQGHTDSPLSTLGRDHAKAAAGWFAGRNIDLVLASPLARAMETAREIATGCGTPEAIAVPELIELDTGIYSAQAIGELREIDPELYARFRVHSWEVVPNAERVASLRRRAAAVWARLINLAESGMRSIVCVSHGGMIQWLIKATIGSDEQRWMPLFKASNCGIFHFQAESTLPAEADEPPIPGTGYYGTWVTMNTLPY